MPSASGVVRKTAKHAAELNPIISVQDSQRFESLSPIAETASSASAMIPEGMTPTRYANARVGMKTSFVHKMAGGQKTYLNNEVIRVTPEVVTVRQTTVSRLGSYVTMIDFPRYLSPENAKRASSPGELVGEMTMKVAGRELSCRVYQRRSGWGLCRTVQCPRILGWTVLHEYEEGDDNWKLRLELIDFEE